MGIMVRLAILFCLLATGLSAQTSDALRQFQILSQPGRGEQVIGPSAQAEWAAVGRVNQRQVEAEQTCTGVLVAPDLVLTASHCIWITEDPALRPAALADRLFVAGWNRGSYAALSSAADARIHPEARPVGGGQDFGHDFAALRLADPPTGIAPLPLGPPPQFGEMLAYIGYSNDRLHAPVLHAPCPVQSVTATLAQIGCRPRGGNSGSPVLRATPDGWEVVAIMVARSGPGGLAAIPDAWVREQISGVVVSVEDTPP